MRGLRAGGRVPPPLRAPAPAVPLVPAVEPLELECPFAPLEVLDAPSLTMLGLRVTGLAPGTTGGISV